jgi:hypothetical protein
LLFTTSSKFWTKRKVENRRVRVGRRREEMSGVKYHGGWVSMKKMKNSRQDVREAGKKLP